MSQDGFKALSVVPLATLQPKQSILVSKGLALADEILRRIGALRASEDPVLIGHLGTVNAVCWSPNGDYLITGGDDSTVRIWDAKRGVETHRFERHSNGISAVAISPDSATIASGDISGVIYLWRFDNSENYQLFGGENIEIPIIQSLAFSLDGERLSATLPGRVRSWELKNRKGTIEKFLDYSRWSTHYASLSSDGTFAVTLEEFDSVAFWGIPSMLRIAEVVEFLGDGPIGFSRDDSILFYSMLESVGFWSTQDQRSFGKIDLSKVADSTARNMNDDWDYLLDVGDASTDWIEIDPNFSLDPFGMLVPYDFWEYVGVPPPHPYEELEDGGWASAVDISPNNRYAVVCFGWGNLQIFNLETKLPEKWNRVHEGGIHSLAWSPSGQAIASGGNDGAIHIWKCYLIDDTAN